ncbi:hypothetical protein FNV43_RR25916 [Rhamnella rubrinervis]|uniref:Histidine kinase/HSP90-like ATPase domain-containing protein n=1 Tax=Rhamnella rubrinervis TaxID=2594499 RepID=A0A8K0GNB1_9ROSA|nr:hypothetical protein FNV43_RR25916 [Rhamnella rubrinervis]
MLLSAITPQNPRLSGPANPNSTLIFPCNSTKVLDSAKPAAYSAQRRPLLFTNALSSPNALRYVSTDEEPGPAMLPSASAVASAIRSASNSPVEFMQRIEKDQKNDLVLPSSDFQRLCIEQLDLFRRIVDPDALLSVYVRPAGSYVMDRLELRRVTAFPGVNAADIVILVGSFSIPTGLRAAEAVLSNQLAEFIPESKAVVFPMVKHPFVVGFLVAEFQTMGKSEHGIVHGQGYDMIHHSTPEETQALPSDCVVKSWDIQTLKDDSLRMYKFTAEQESNAINISRSLAMAYVMDQKAMLLQQSSWQNNVRMSNLVEQIRGPLSTIRTLSKMLSIHTKRTEISFDIVEDILAQGDRMRDTLQQLQDAVYLTKANIVHYNEETLKKMPNSSLANPEAARPPFSHNFPRDRSSTKMQNPPRDVEMPMPPPALSPVQQHGIRPCNVSDVLADLVEAVSPLAHKQQRAVDLSEATPSLQVAIEEPSLRQALSNLIEGALLRTKAGGKVEIVSIRAPAGGALVVIDDDGPDMHYMTQMHSLTPFGTDLCSDEMVEDNMTWNFIAGLTVAREILESYGCVVRVISPRTKDAALGAGGTRVELWLPCSTTSPDFDGAAQVL